MFRRIQTPSGERSFSPWVVEWLVVWDPLIGAVPFPPVGAEDVGAVPLRYAEAEDVGGVAGEATGRMCVAVRVLGWVVVEAELPSGLDEIGEEVFALMRLKLRGRLVSADDALAEGFDVVDVVELPGLVEHGHVLSVLAAMPDASGCGSGAKCGGASSRCFPLVLGLPNQWVGQAWVSGVQPGP